MSDIAEILLAQIWNSQWFWQPLRTSQGGELRVVYPGVWTHGFGPDFSNAMVEIDGRLQTGDIEVDLSVSGWHEHGHDQNLAFNNVILHVVARETDTRPVRRPDGCLVQRVVLLNYLRGPLEDFPETTGLRPLGAIGFDTCAVAPARERPDLIREICQRAGDRRMQDRVSTLSGELAVSAPAQVLYARLLDALGFSRNREPMAELAERLQFEQLTTRLTPDDPTERYWRAASLLLGVGGFLPLSPQDSAAADLDPPQVGRIERLWSELGDPWRGGEVSPGLWSMSRARPAAHPVRRLLAAAVLLGTAGPGLVGTLLRLLSDDNPRRSLERWLSGENRYLGKAHAHEIVVNVVIPFALAYGELAGQPDVVEVAADLWQRLPAGRGNTVTKRTLRQICGDVDVKSGSARAEQGLIHINRNGCSQMRCFECPVAHLALNWEGEKEASA